MSSLRRTLLFVVPLALFGVLSLTVTTRGQPAPFEVQVAASGLEVPWDLTFAPDGSLYFTERPGKVGRLSGGELTVLATPDQFEGLRVEGEGGLLGMALDPEFPETPFIYVCYSYTDGQGADRLKVARFELSARGLDDATTLLQDIPSGQVHNGCRMTFGPDGKLYLTTGDSPSQHDAQDPTKLNGKILRINPDGSIPDDNPFGNAVWTIGHRNPQGLVFHPRTGRLYSSEHGPDHDDEINLIEQGRNYGWPEATGTRGLEPYTPALVAYTPPLAVAGMDVYMGELFPEWQGDLLLVSLRAGELHRLELDEEGRIIRDELLLDGSYGRLRAVAVSPEGAIYIATSNRDGRSSNPDPTDDRILVLRPSTDR